MAYFKAFPDVEVIETAPFWTYMSKIRHRNLDDSKLASLKDIIDQCTQDADPAIDSGMLEQLTGLSTAGQILDVLSRYDRGDEVDIRESLGYVMDKHDQMTNRVVKKPTVDANFDEVINVMTQTRGFTFPLTVLAVSLRPLVAGDFIIVAARPDVGKTSFVAQAVTHMAKQLPVLFPDQGKRIAWLNNEGPGKRVKMRLRQAALEVGMTEFVERYKAGTLEVDFADAIGGEDYIDVMDIHGYSSGEVEKLLKDGKYAIVVIDMIDNVKFTGDLHNGGSRTDQMLEEQYKWFRDLGTKYGFAGIAMSQVSADGDGLMYPKMHMLKDSKTGKQGACDTIIMIGCTDPELTTRGVSVPKNKHKLEGVGRIRSECTIEPSTGCYHDPITIE